MLDSGGDLLRPLRRTTTGSQVYTTNAPPRIAIGTVANAPPPAKGILSPFENKVNVPLAGGVELWVIGLVLVGIVLLLVALH
jgi:hypothetical protein